MRSGLVIEESCGIINRMTGDKKVEWSVIDPSTAKRNSQTGRRDMDEFARYGVPCVPGDNRDRGYDITKMFFKKNMIKIHPKCKNLILQLKTVQWSDKEGEDMTDCLRYICVRIHDFMFGGRLFESDAKLKEGRCESRYLGLMNLNDPDVFTNAKRKNEVNGWLQDEIKLVA